MSLLSEGKIISETYEVERFLGEGAFAEVYRVKHRFLGRQAMKVFKIVGITIEEIEKMLGEAILLSRIGHPNIIRVFDANITETPKGLCGFFTMEYVAGGSLDQFWRSHGAQFVPIETAVEILRQVCRGLTIAHDEKPPIIHRDIKPQNILIGYDATGIRARISDFGLAKRVNPLTLLASARGTRCFKAPEAFRDFQSDSCAGDVWALGSTLYLLLTDQLPFPGIADMDILESKCFEQPTILPHRLNPRIDTKLEKIILKALKIKPEERYSNAREMLGDLEKWKICPLGETEKHSNERSGYMSKSALGQFSQTDGHIAQGMVTNATKLSRQAGKLMEAADLLEEAMNKWPKLRHEYEYQLKLWRRGVVM
ncbi:MAG: serine/threonine-protein kinase [Thermodesulfobacteriota bacterium]|nr:serine/threonine-protein kinase [Thermodesulfobacteriota bacterium]